MSIRNKVAIVGSGIAGLSCATALQKVGFNVTLFEKSRGVSGRLSTRINEQWQCDHGAQYFTARNPTFNDEVARWIKANVAKPWHPRLMVTDGVHFAVKEGETHRYVGYPQNSAPAKWLAQSLHVESQHTITGLVRTADKWQLMSKEHGLKTENFDHVILAIPAPQAAVLLKESAPELHGLIAGIKMQACFALMINVQQTLNCDFDGLFVNHGILSWLARDSAKPGRLDFNHRYPQTNNEGVNHTHETWILHANSEWSELHVEDDKEAVAQQMLTAFKNLIKRACADEIQLQSYQLHRWLYADCAQYLTCGYQLDTKLNIGLCGDWLNGGKVQGAWLSGLLLADQISSTTELVSY